MANYDNATTFVTGSTKPRSVRAQESAGCATYHDRTKTAKRVDPPKVRSYTVVLKDGRFVVKR